MSVKPWGSPFLPLGERAEMGTHYLTKDTVQYFKNHFTESLHNQQAIFFSPIFYIELGTLLHHIIIYWSTLGVFHIGMATCLLGMTCLSRQYEMDCCLTIPLPVSKYVPSWYLTCKAGLCRHLKGCKDLPGLKL